MTEHEMYQDVYSESICDHTGCGLPVRWTCTQCAHTYCRRHLRRVPVRAGRNAFQRVHTLCEVCRQRNAARDREDAKLVGLVSAAGLIWFVLAWMVSVADMALPLPLALALGSGIIIAPLLMLVCLVAGCTLIASQGYR
jgi:hypothetical protein